MKGEWSGRAACTCACAVEVPRVREQSSNEHVESILPVSSYLFFSPVRQRFRPLTCWPGRRASSAMSCLLAPPSWGHRGGAPWPHLCHTYTVSPWSRYRGAWIKGELMGKAQLEVNSGRYAHSIMYVQRVHTFHVHVCTTCTYMYMYSVYVHRVASVKVN